MPNTVQVAITAANTALPELSKTEQAIVHLSSTAQSQVGGMSRFSAAFSRLEAREPSMALRQLRTNMEGLALSGIGAEGPVGRLGAALGLLGAGTGVGLVALGGIAAITLAIKEQGKAAHETTDQIKKLTDGIATSVRGLESPFARLQTQQAGLQRLLGNLSGQIHEQETVLGQQDGTSLGSLGGLLAADPGELVRRGIAAAGLRTLHEQRQQVETGLAGIGALQGADPGALARARQTAAVFDKLSEAAAETRVKISLVRQGIVDFGDPRAVRALTEVRLAFEGLPPAVAKAAAAMAASNAALERTMFHVRPDLAPLAVAPITQRYGFPLRLPPDLLKPKTVENVPGYTGIPYRPDATPGLDFGALAPMLPGILASMTGGGGTGGVLTGFGGIVSALSKTSPLGIGLSAAGGILSLFGGGGNKVHVTIDSYEKEALDQMKTLRGDPATRDVILVNASDPRQTLYQSGRLGRRDATSRGP